MDINKSLQFFMDRDQMSSVELSRVSKINPSTISLIRNKHRSPRASTLLTFAATFNVDVSEFIAAGE
jgi:transcriptional regulator with XRE-family HTH domain